MTIFSLGNACDLEHFTNNTKLESIEDFQMKSINSPVVPMPTDPPFSDTNYQWKSESAVARDMTTRDSNSNTFRPAVGTDSQGWGTVQNYGGDYWGGNTVDYQYDNKLLNNNMQANQFQSDGQDMMPNMRQQGAHMPPVRSHIVDKEDFNGRDKAAMAEARRRAMKPKVVEVVLPPFPKERIMSEQKTAWIAVIIAFLVVICTLMYKSRMFG